MLSVLSEQVVEPSLSELAMVLDVVACPDLVLVKQQAEVRSCQVVEHASLEPA